MPAIHRRNFLKAAGILSVPSVIPLSPALGQPQDRLYEDQPVVKLFGDGEMFDPAAYISELQKINAVKQIEPDRYGVGGAVAELEKKMAQVTGKERAVLMPTGTMANQFAISVLSGENAKVVVQETSHVFRDEADAAQAVFGKRLVALAPGATFFTASQLEEGVEDHKKKEAFVSEVGCVSIENPVRRADGRMIPLDEIKKISKYCRSKNIKLHLDGARIYMAAAWSGISVKEYAAYFDTIYISLYKYLGASAGAVLCGSSETMGKMERLVKIHGGSMYRNWPNAAMALHRLEGMESRLLEAKARSKEIFEALNRLPGIRITPLEGGTNIYSMVLGKNVKGKLLVETLNKKYNIRMGFPGKTNETKISVNETILYQEAQTIIDAFGSAVKEST